MKALPQSRKEKNITHWDHKLNVQLNRMCLKRALLLKGDMRLCYFDWKRIEFNKFKVGNKKSWWWDEIRAERRAGILRNDCGFRIHRGKRQVKTQNTSIVWLPEQRNGLNINQRAIMQCLKRSHLEAFCSKSCTGQ